MSGGVENHYGKWTVISEISRKSGQRRVLARCACGLEGEIYLASLLRKDRPSRSCYKCSKPNRGRKGTRAFESWRSMHRRCSETTNPSFQNYGGRGIRVCETWGDFNQFLSDMGEPPKGMSLDRINNEGGYSPENCRWATPFQQVVNRRKFKSRNKRPVTSRFRGVHLSKNGTWQAQISVSNKTVYLGRFKSESAAALAYNVEAIIHGHRLNDVTRGEA
jgi:hypothetical protein